LTQVQSISLNDVPVVIESGTLAESQYLKAVSFLRNEGFWKKWAIGALLALAVGHILSGIIFFFAYNWDDMAAVTKFTVVGGGLAACLLAWVLAKLDSPAGQAFGIGATVLVGVMFAVLGQVYQTPAMLHTPFVLWAVLTLPFALVSKNLAHWTVWLVLLTVAVTTYANSGLRLAGKDLAANGLNIGMAAGLFIVLVIFDKVLAPRAKWARAEWFRVLLVLGSVWFMFWGLCESVYFRSGQGLWMLSLVLGVGLVVYLYVLKPSLSTLSVASFGVFVMAAQLGFLIFDDFDVVDFFVNFIWAAVLTIGLVAIFGHYINRHKAGHMPSFMDIEGKDELVLTSVEAFSQHLGLQALQVAEVLSADAAQQQPWYMSVFLALAGVFTAVLGVGFFVMMLFLTIGFKDEYIYGIVGFSMFVIALLLRLIAKSPYLQHLLNTLIVIGGLLTALGFGIELSDFDSVMALIFMLSLVVLILVRDPILEFMSAAALITVIGMELYHLHVPLVESVILILATGLGVVFISCPIRNRLYKSAGMAFLMAPAVLGIALIHANRWDSLADPSRLSDDLFARGLSILVLFGAIFYLNRGKTLSDFKPPLIVLAPLLIAAALVPLGGASALLLMIIGYILGSRSIAIIGTVLQVYFLVMFYYDLSLMSLLRYAGIAIGTLGITAFFGSQITALEAIKKDGEYVLLDLRPADPRALMMGDFMALRYVEERTNRLPRGLAPAGQFILALDGNKVGTFKRLADEAALGPDEVRINYIRRSQGVTFGAPRYYFQNGTAKTYERADYGIFKISPKGRAILVGLADGDFKKIEPPEG